MAHIAGVSNASHTVFGMMPHPERAASADLANTDGLGILKGLLSWVTA
jgi:phosphoribosylformylglycinamidine synthase